MNTTPSVSVELQDPFSYSTLPVIISGVVVIVLILTLLILFLVKNRKPKEKTVVAPTPTKSLPHSKKKALAALAKLQQKLAAEQIDIREAYQQMSKIMRVFVSEVTGTKVTNFTLDEVRQRGPAVLEKLMIEYYPPEFEQRSKGDANTSIIKTMKVIEEWN